METKKTVVEKYSKELEKIEEQIELLKEGEIFDFQLLNRIINLTISAYYDGKGDGLKQMHEILKD